MDIDSNNCAKGIVLKNLNLTLLPMLGSLVLVVLLSVGCNDGDNTKNENDTANECVPVFVTGNTPDGGSCMQLDDCASGFCAVYSHTPTNSDGTCQPAPPHGDIHMLANIRDFITDEMMPNVTIKLGGAIDISQNPTGFPVANTLISDANGRVDTMLTGDTTRLTLGIMAVVEADGYYPTLTGLAKPEAGCGFYEPGIRNPDIKMIKTDDLTRLSDALLAGHPTLADNLPLGEKGGVVGVIRNVNTGETVSGIKIRSANSASVAQLYYLNDSRDAFTTDMSSSTGIFVILHPGMAEDFSAYQNDVIVSRRPATLGETAGVLLTTTVQVQ